VLGRLFAIPIDEGFTLKCHPILDGDAAAKVLHALEVPQGPFAADGRSTPALSSAV
jgi:hypothetical protein